MKRILFSLLVILGLSVTAEAARTRYVSTSGNDAADGLTTSTPWKHMPGMNIGSGGVCSSVCAAFTPTGDDTFIFKGGDTWTYGGSGGIPFFLTQNGTSGHPITISSGDHTWFTGASWSRPKWDMQYLSNQIFTFFNNSYITIADIDMTGIVSEQADERGIVRILQSHHIILDNCWLHAWTLTGSGSRTDGNHGGLYTSITAPNLDWAQTNQFINGRISNEEFSGPASGYTQNGIAIRQAGIIRNSEIDHVSSAILFAYDVNGNNIHDIGGANNQPTNWDQGVAVYHTNVTYVEPGVVGATTAYIRNNVITNAQTGAYNLYPNPSGNSTVQVYNNVVKGPMGSHEPVGIDTYTVGGGGSPSVYICNNVLDISDAGTSVTTGIRVIGGMDRPDLLNFTSCNNQFIYSTGITQDNATGFTVNPPVRNNNLNQTVTTANAQLYFAVNNYAPTNGSGGTIDAGFDASAVFTADIYGNTRTGTWDIGPYQYVAGAADYYVSLASNSPAGNDSNPCSLAAPCLTLAHVKTLVACGDTIYFRAGTYTVPWTFSDADTRCLNYTLSATIRNYQSEHVIVRPGGSYRYAFQVAYDQPSPVTYYWRVIASAQDKITFTCADCASSLPDLNGSVSSYGAYWWMENVEITGAVSSGLGGNMDHWTVVNPNIHNNGIAMLAAPPHGVYIHGDNNLFDGGIYHDNPYGLGIQIFDSSTCLTGVESDCSDDNIIRNARIYDNNSGMESGGGGLIVSTGNRNLVYNNLIYGNVLNGINVDIRCYDCAAYNNTVYDNTGNGIYIGNGNGGAFDTVVRNNISYLNTSSNYSNLGTDTVPSNNLLGTDPDFTDAAMGDFTIESTSDARGYGLNLTYLGITPLNVDFVGNTRPAVATWDAGAYQYVNPICTPHHLSFSDQPASALVGANLGTVVVQILDSGDVHCTDATNTISLAPSGGATWASLASSSNLSKAAVAGDATWTDLSVSPTAGAGTILAASSGLTGATSNSITISAPVIAGTGTGVRARIRIR